MTEAKARYSPVICWARPSGQESSKAKPESQSVGPWPGTGMWPSWRQTHLQQSLVQDSAPGLSLTRAHGRLWERSQVRLLRAINAC